MFAGILTIALLADAARIEPISPREAAPVPFFHLRTRARFEMVDVRDCSALWVDDSGPGQTPCYSRAPARDLASGAADRLDYASAKAAGCRAP